MKSQRSILDFGSINRAALATVPDLLLRWLPDGRIQGQEFVARNPRRTDRRPGSFRINMATGKLSDFAADLNPRNPNFEGETRG